MNNKSITSLVNKMQQILEQQNGKIVGGFLPITPPIDNPSVRTQNQNGCNNHSCPDSDNGGSCTNHTTCDGSTNQSQCVCNHVIKLHNYDQSKSI